MKLTVIQRLELAVSAEPVVHSTVGKTTGSSAGEVFVGAQGVLYRGEDVGPTLAVSYFHRAYDGPAPEFDFGSPTNSFLVLGSGDIKGFHYDANAFFTELVQQAVRRAQFGQSLSISHAFFKNFTVAGEIWHFTQPFLRSNAVGSLWAVSYTARKTLVFDHWSCWLVFSS